MIKYYISKVLKRLRLSAIKDSIIDPASHISAGNTILGSKIGKYTYTGYDVSILYATIGRYCSIAEKCKIGGAAHPVQWVSTSPLFHRGKNVFKKNFALHEFEPYTHTYIGNDVWIGQNVLIKSGISIGDGAVIGMGSVVTKDVGPYEIWAGNPAKFIRKRFDDKTIQQLENIHWWLWDEKKIMQCAEYMKSVREFCNIIEGAEE